jgi:AraC family transcriptional regulator, regulatory protein of adaptative response / DNA-3-methyladenine glycosylase II
LAQTAAARIETGYLNEHTLDALARSLKVSTRHVRRAMKRELGISPIDAALTQRARRAEHLLRNSLLPIAEIALASGFGSIRRFNAVFKREYGVTPNTYRAKRSQR